jgi:hypothetical protein
MPIPSRLTTLTSIRTQLQIAGTLTTDDAFIDDQIDKASAWIFEHTRERAFVPYLDTRSIRQDALTEPARSRWGGYIAPRLMVDEDLLAVRSIANGDAVASAVTDYNLLPLNSYPKDTIELTSASGSAWNFESYDSDVSITGFWGYHPDYRYAWENASSLTATLTASDTLAAVASVSSYEDGDYVLIGGSEIGRVTGTSTGTLTLLRGQNGTTAAAYGSLVAVQPYQFPSDIQKACNDLVKYYYIHRKSDAVAQIVDVGVRLETKVPTDIWDTVERYKKSDFQATGEWHEW